MKNKYIYFGISFIVVILSIGIVLILNNSQNDLESIDIVGVTEDEIIIGSSSALSGHASFLGTQTIHGSLAYINEINSEGGIYGRKIKLIAYDDSYDPEKTVSNTQKLINKDRVFVLFDYVGTPTSVKVIDMIHQSEIPSLGFFTGAEALRVPFRPYIFNVRDSYYEEAESAVAYFVDKLGHEKVAIFYQEDAFGLAVLKGAQLALNDRNMKPVATATFHRGTLDVEEAAQVIKESGAQSIIMVGTYSPLAKFVKSFEKESLFPYFHTVSFVGSEAFAKELIQVQNISTSKYEKIIVTQVVPSPYSENFQAVEEYKQLLKKYYPDDNPNYVALEGFINAKILVKGLKDAGSDLTREKFMNAMELIHNFDIGIEKDLTYSVLDHQGLDGIYYSRLSEDGLFKIFNPYSSI